MELVMKGNARILGAALALLSASAAHAQESSRPSAEYLRQATPLIHWPQGLEPRNVDVFVHNEDWIDAPPDVVWTNLIDATQWPSWYSNSADVRIHGGQPRLAQGVRPADFGATCFLAGALGGCVVSSHRESMAHDFIADPDTGKELQSIRDGGVFRDDRDGAKIAIVLDAYLYDLGADELLAFADWDGGRRSSSNTTEGACMCCNPQFPGSTRCRMRSPLTSQW
jgi:hypothetical protein